LVRDYTLDHWQPSFQAPWQARFTVSWAWRGVQRDFPPIEPEPAERDLNPSPRVEEMWAENRLD